MYGGDTVANCVCTWKVIWLWRSRVYSFVYEGKFHVLLRLPSNRAVSNLHRDESDDHIFWVCDLYNGLDYLRVTALGGPGCTRV